MQRSWRGTVYWFASPGLLSRLPKTKQTTTTATTKNPAMQKKEASKNPENQHFEIFWFLINRLLESGCDGTCL